jgi:hypothetical protein
LIIMLKQIQKIQQNININNVEVAHVLQ